MRNAAIIRIARPAGDAPLMVCPDRLPAFAMPALMAAIQHWGVRVFGSGPRTGPLLDHLDEEIQEVAADPDDAVEWADCLLIALDGAARHGFTWSLLASLVARDRSTETLERRSAAVRRSPSDARTWAHLIAGIQTRASAHGIPGARLRGAARTKMAINRERRWSANDAGVIRHVAGGDA